MAFEIVATKRIKARARYSLGVLTAEREYGVTFTGEYDELELLAAAGAAGLPIANGAHPTNANLFVSDIDVDLDDNSPANLPEGSLGYAIYSVKWGTPSFDAILEHPLDRPAEITWSGANRTEVARTDIDGNPLINSSSDLYDSLPERPIQGAECTITYNIAANPASICNSFSNTVNSGSIWGVAAGNALIGIISATQQSEMYNGVLVTYWRVTVPIAFNNNGWAVKLIDNGYKIVDGDTKTVQTDENGTPTPVPILLDGAGGELAAGADPVIFPADGYKIIYESAFAELDLENPFA